MRPKPKFTLAAGTLFIWITPNREKPNKSPVILFLSQSIERGIMSVQDRKQYGISLKWKQWITLPSKERFEKCKLNQGKIFHWWALIPPISPGHLYCRCHIEFLKTIQIGKATSKGTDGADWYLYFAKQLPNYYITKAEAEALGFKSKMGNGKFEYCSPRKNDWR